MVHMLKRQKKKKKAGLKSKYSEPAFIICSYWENKKDFGDSNSQALSDDWSTL